MPSINGSDIKHIIVACDAGMGSSVLLTSQLSKQLGPHGVEVTHSPVGELDNDKADLVLCHQGLVDRARNAAPETVVLPFQMFMGDPLFAQVEAAIKNGSQLDA